MLKTEARKLFRKKRAGITVVQKQKLDDLLLIQFQKVALPSLYTVLSYMPIDENNEIDTFPITRYLQFSHPGLQVAYPRTDTTQQTMEAVLTSPDTEFVENRYGILEPENGPLVEPEHIDLVLVPALVCDRTGHRVGYGKGYYDRFLKRSGEGCIKVGLSYFDPVPIIDDAGEFDVPLNYCITPQTTYVF